MTAKKLTDKVLLIEFPTIKEMTLTMFRIQEFYEGKEGIKGQYFTADQFIDAYSDEKGDIDYFSYWEGFNVPTSIISDFFNVFPDISEREKEILEAIVGNGISSLDGYIITCVEGDEITLKHEMCHVYFFEDIDYKAKSLAIVSSIPLDIWGKLKASLVKLDYCDEVILDEMQAYLTAYDQEEWDECFPDIKYDEIKEFVDKLNELYKSKVNV